MERILAKDKGAVAKALDFIHSKLPTFWKAQELSPYIRKQTDYIQSGQRETFFQIIMVS